MFAAICRHSGFFYRRRLAAAVDTSAREYGVDAAEMLLQILRKYCRLLNRLRKSLIKIGRQDGLGGRHRQASLFRGISSLDRLAPAEKLQVLERWLGATLCADFDPEHEAEILREIARRITVNAQSKRRCWLSRVILAQLTNRPVGVRSFCGSSAELSFSFGQGQFWLANLFIREVRRGFPSPASHTLGPR